MNEWIRFINVQIDWLIVIVCVHAYMTDGRIAAHCQHFARYSAQEVNHWETLSATAAAAADDDDDDNWIRRHGNQHPPSALFTVI